MTTKKRITVYVEEQDYIQLRSKLILVGKTVTSWLEEVINKEINKEEV